MTDREDAVMLADDIEIYGLQNDEERGWFLSSEGERLIVSALRAYAAEPVTPAALRKKIAAAIRSYAPQENADAAFRVIHDGGFVLVPREPTEAMVEAATAEAARRTIDISDDARNILRSSIAAAEKETEK